LDVRTCGTMSKSNYCLVDKVLSRLLTRRKTNCSHRTNAR
jgi:hypothetical protein